MAVAYLIENRGASLLLKKRASGFFKFPKNDLNDLNGWKRLERASVIGELKKGIKKKFSQERFLALETHCR
jgi:hypothetical protein